MGDELGVVFEGLSSGTFWGLGSSGAAIGGGVPFLLGCSSAGGGSGGGVTVSVGAGAGASTASDGATELFETAYNII